MNGAFAQISAGARNILVQHSSTTISVANFRITQNPLQGVLPAMHGPWNLKLIVVRANHGILNWLNLIILAMVFTDDFWHKDAYDSLGRTRRRRSAAPQYPVTGDSLVTWLRSTLTCLILRSILIWATSDLRKPGYSCMMPLNLQNSCNHCSTCWTMFILGIDHRALSPM